jgi:hypothetical protein
MGGQSGGRGYLLQAMYALLESLKPSDGWSSVTIEPNDESEKVDIVWQYPSRRKVVQVKHSQNPMTKPMVETWAAELEAASQADDYFLILLGPCASKLTKIGSIGKVFIPTPMTVNIEALRFQAAHLLDSFLRERDSRCVTSPGARELIVDAMSTRLSEFSTEGKHVSRDSFERLLSSWIEEIDPSITYLKKSVSAKLKATYCRWIQESFASFFVPGMNVRLPIEHAWVQLRVMRDDNSIIGTKTQLDEQLRNYLEFGIRRRNPDRSVAVASDLLPSRISAIVLVGGPGAGKSTALKRFAWRMSFEGMVVIHVRLPLLTQLINNGASFDDGLLRLGFDGSGIEEADRRQLIEAADLLLCDGLDECDPHRSMISQKLMQWRIGHPKCRVCVSTRPVGHEAAYLPNFTYYSLLPPEQHQLRGLSSTLFRECSKSQNPEVECTEFLAMIESKHRANPLKVLASQNPLLLGFLIKLHIDKVNVGNSRCNLYGCIFRLMLRTKPNDRNATEINERLACSVIQSLAWKLTGSPFADNEATIGFVVEHIQRTFELTVLAAEKEVANCIQFWEERRMLETITIGMDRKTFFVHMSLQEFAAAQHASSLDDGQFRQWLTDVRRLPAWTQVILLTCGLDNNDRTIVTLLELDTPADVVSCEAILATDGFLESDVHRGSTSDLLLHALRQRLTSDVPLVSVEATLSLSKMVSNSKDGVRKIVAEWRADTPWASMSLLLLRLLTEDGPRVVDEFKEWFLKYELVLNPFLRLTKRDDAQFIPKEGREVQDEIFRIGMDRMFASDDAEAIDAYFKNVGELGEMPSWMLSDLQKRLTEIGLTQVARRLWPTDFDAEIKRISSGIERWSKGRIVLLKLIVVACGPASDKKFTPPFHGLSAFFACISFWESAAGATGAMETVDPTIDEAGGELIRAIATALRIDFADLAAQAKCAIEMCENDNKRFFDLIEEVDVECDWSKLSDAKLNCNLIAEALLHSFSLFSVVAAKMIHAGIATCEARKTIPIAINSEFGHTVRAGALLSYHCCGESATDILLDRLKSPISSEHAILFDVLAEKIPSERCKEVTSIFFANLKCKSPKLAAEVAMALDKLKEPIGNEYVYKLRDAYNEWMRREELEANTPEDGINVVPNSPRPALLKLLDRLDNVTFGEWVTLVKDRNHDVRSLAKATILDRAAASETVLTHVVSLVESGELTASMLGQMLKLPIRTGSQLAKNAESLLHSDKLDVRLASMAQLTGDWIEPKTAIGHLQAALSDASPAVRTLATRILRLFH